MRRKKKQATTRGELTFDRHDKDPHTRKVQITKTDKSLPKKPRKLARLGAVVAKKHLTVFPIRKRRKGVGTQVTKGGFVYKRSKARLGSPLYDKWYKLRKGESIEEAKAREGSLGAILVDSPPVK